MLEMLIIAQLIIAIGTRYIKYKEGQLSKEKALKEGIVAAFIIIGMYTIAKVLIFLLQ
ncbi:MAG: hypothetical protein ACK5KR_00455 [Breznakia sp.]